MDNWVIYNGVRIEAVPNQLADGSAWTTEVNISVDTGGSTTVMRYSAGNQWPSKEEAISHCIEFGKRIVDGELSPPPVNAG